MTVKENKKLNVRTELSTLIGAPYLYKVSKLKHVCVFAFLLAVSGTSHEVFIQRVSPVAPAGPVTHGRPESELISSFKSNTTSHPNEISIFYLSILSI